jgi:hypothetical protein
MGFLERARSTRGRHQRTRSTKVDEPVLQTAPSPMKPTTKRTSIFPGLSSNVRPETTRPRAASARTSANHSAVFERPKIFEDIDLPPNTAHFTGNHSFKCPSPALVNTKPKRTPPTSVAHLPTMPDSNTSTFSPAPMSSARATPPSWHRSTTDPVLSTTQREALPKQATAGQHPPQDSASRPQLKKQKSAWKSFGDLFRGKQSRQPNPEQFYKVQPPSNEHLAQTGRTSNGRIGVLESPVPSPVGKDERTVSRVDSGHDSLDPSRETGMNGLLPPTKSFPARVDSRNDPRADGEAGARRLLDINIPNAGFDRYSVMFEKLLEPKVPLLERRQSKRKSCRTGKSPSDAPKAIQPAKGLQRSVTSPSLNRMPSLTIHIANSNYAIHSSQARAQQQKPTAAPRPAPPKRSMTTPSTTTSPLVVPSRGATASMTPRTARAIPLSESTTTSNNSPRCSILSENSLPPTPNTAVSFASSINTTIFGPEPTRTQPSANKVSSPPSESRRPLMRNYPTGSERFDRQIVQVSVARQVSVSKARSRVADAVEVKQPLRPRVVELGKNRKSTLVMIESGDS